MDVTVGGGEIISQGALVGDLHAVADHVKASSVQTGEQAVPIALHILRLHAQLFGDGAGDLHIIAHQSVALVMVAPGSAVEPAAEDAPELAAVEVLLLEQPDRVRTPAAAMTLIIEIKVLRFIVKILS